MLVTGVKTDVDTSIDVGALESFGGNTGLRNASRETCRDEECVVNRADLVRPGMAVQRVMSSRGLAQVALWRPIAKPGGAVSSVAYSSFAVKLARVH